MAHSDTSARGKWAAARNSRRRLRAVLLFGCALWAAGGLRPAVAQNSPVPNFGFETGDLRGWSGSCFGEDGGCANWNASVGPAYARSGQFGARLFVAQVGRWGHARLYSSWFDDTSATYTLPLKLAGGATQFYSGVIVYILDSTGAATRYNGNTRGSSDCWPPDDPYHCGLFRLIPGAWVEYTFDFQADFVRLYGRLPRSRRQIVIDAYQDDDFVELYLDDLLVPRTQQSPVAVAGLALSRSVVRSAEVVTGLVTLSSPAPPEGALVTITSRNQAAPAPPPLFIPAGESAGSFALPAAFAPTTRDGWITATYGGAGRSADLTVVPGPVTTLALGSNPVLGGVPTTGAVQLLAPAAPERLDVTLASSSPAAASVPERLSIRPADSSASFTVTTAPVAAPTPVFLTAASPAGVATVRLDVAPPMEQPGRLAAIAVNPETVIGGSGATATVMLSGPAPPGGAVVALATDDSAVVTAPASVTVPAGATYAQVPLTTYPVASARSAAVTASYAGITRTAALGVESPTLSAVAVEPPAMLGGESAIGTVTLTGPAPAGGAVVALSTASPWLSAVPASVTVAAGMTSASFPVATGPVAAPTSVVVTAAWNGTTRSVALALAPAGTLWLAIRDNQVLGSRATAATVRRIGPPVSEPAAITLSSDNPAVAAVPAQVILPPGENTATFTVTTTPVPSPKSVVVTATLADRAASGWVQVLPPQLAALGVQPAALPGGVPVTGTVTLTGPAPTGGIVVTLASENERLAAAPATVVVPAGATTVSFPVTTRAVAAPSYVSLAAGFGGRMRTATLILNPPSLAALALASDTLVGGGATTATVTLDGPAPEGGVPITLSSSNPAVAQTPATVTVPAGETRAAFPITTSPVAATTPVVITASAGGASRQSTLVVRPPQ